MHAHRRAAQSLPEGQVAYRSWGYDGSPMAWRALTSKPREPRLLLALVMTGALLGHLLMLVGPAQPAQPALVAGLLVAEQSETTSMDGHPSAATTPHDDPSIHVMAAMCLAVVSGLGMAALKRRCPPPDQPSRVSLSQSRSPVHRFTWLPALPRAPSRIDAGVLRRV